MNLTSKLKTLLCGAVALTAVGMYSAPASAQALHAYCDDYARDYAAEYGRGRGRILGGAGAGAAAGAIIGAIVGGGRAAGKGAAIGGGIGAIGGAASKSRRYNRTYQQAYDDCIVENSRSRRRAAPARVVLEPWTPEWYDYCASRFRSFNARTGYYTTYSGRKKFCQ